MGHSWLSLFSDLTESPLGLLSVSSSLRAVAVEPLEPPSWGAG